MLNSYGSGDMEDYLIYFVNSLNPNGPTVPEWPQYSASNPQLMTFVDGILTTLEITQDNYREDAISYLTELSFLYPI